MSPNFSCDEDLAYIAAGLISTTLPKAEWTHAAHFAAALWLLRHGETPAEQALPSLIRRYNEATGGINSDMSGYHETITLASVRAAAHWLDRFPSGHALYDIANHLMASDLGRSGWLLAYWSRERLFSPGARRDWLDADLAEFPY